MIVSWAQALPTRWLKAICILVFLSWAWIHFFWTPTGPGRVHRVLPGGSDPWSTTSDVQTQTETLCRQHGFKPFRPVSGQRRKVYDLVMVNNELDWLEIRLNSTWDEVDYYVIVEAPKTFTGLDKPLTILENMDFFKAYHSKIIYHVLEYPADFNPKRTWDREDLQRNAMFTQVLPRLTGPQAPAPNDVLIIADVDEIPRPETLSLLRACTFPARLTLRSRFYYYGFQFLHRGPEWAHPQATTYRGSKTILPVNLRNGDGGLPPLIWFQKADLWNAGWHCSSCFRTVEEVLGKMGSFSHVWMNHELFRDPKRIVDRVRQGKDIWDREGEIYDRVEDNEDLPSFVRDHRKRFGYLLDREGESAGFEDYKPE